MAWTAFWWYEDYDLLNQSYSDVECFAINSTQAADLQLLTNVWQILTTSVRAGKLTEDTADHGARTTRLRKELQRLASDSSRPNSALQARTDLLLVDLEGAASEGRDIDQILAGLQEVLQESENLASYRVEPLIELVHVFGENLGENEAYDALFESAVELAERRASRGTVGLALLTRGHQKLQADKAYDAIRLFGCAQPLLALHEYRSEFITVLGGCGQAYERAGLLWAARANLILAANQALAEHWEHGTVTPLALLCVQKLIWLELQLGRVPSVLEWMELAGLLAARVLMTSGRPDSLKSGRPRI